MASSEQQMIVHPGVVDHLENETVYIRILSQSACATCHAKGACSIAEEEDKIITVHPPDYLSFKPGDQVTIRMKQSLGKKALFLGYILPLIILVASIGIFIWVFTDEGLAALLSILLLGPYYFILYLLRDKLKQQFHFSIYSRD